MGFFVFADYPGTVDGARQVENLGQGLSAPFSKQDRANDSKVDVLIFQQVGGFHQIRQAFLQTNPADIQDTQG